MKHCDKCNLDVVSGDEFCPLCNALLLKINDKIETVFPYIPTIYEKYSKFFKILYFICAVISSISILVNIFLVPNNFFSLFVVLGVICLLLVLKIAIDNRKNMPKTILLYVFVLSILSVVWDYSVGWNGWSLSYAIPIICTMGSLDMAIIVIVMKIYISEYLIYYMTVGFLGLIPILFLFFQIVIQTIPSLICIFFNTIIVLFMFFLQKDTVFTEIKRRFHI